MNDLYKTGSMIENFLSMLLTKAKISSIISFDETPLTISSDSTDMIVVDVLSVNDYGGEAKCSANIFLYAKSTDSLGSKPVKKLFDMEKTLFIIRKSKFPQNPKRSVRFSGKGTKRSVQKRKARNTQKAETKVL